MNSAGVRLLLVLLSAPLLFWACGDGAPSAGPESHVAHQPPVHTLLPFTVRGRWQGQRRISYGFTDSPGPLETPVFERAIERALTAWAATGQVTFERSTAGSAPQITFGWQGQKPEPGGSPGFKGWDGILAHTGPMGPRSWVRFFDNLTWTEAGPKKHALFQTALHEIGHLLGLDESPDPNAVMHPDHNPAHTELTAADLAGLHSLYGGGRDQTGDVLITPHPQTLDAPQPLTLRMVAAVPQPRLALLDTDGNGSAELLVWSKERNLFGALAVLYLDRSFRLTKTVGPMPAAMPVRYQSFFARTKTGQPVLIHPLVKRRYDAWTFTEAGLPGVRLPEGSPLELEGGLQDRDGNREFDADFVIPAQPIVLRADINGDGLIDELRVLTPQGR